jgi:pimeloyl-ACP methyl ester carboxylesterase
MNIWGYAVPGLAMAAAELPEIPGLIRLENPEIGNGPRMTSSYTVEDIADMHTARIRESSQAQDELLIIGMSMGALIAAAMGSEFRSRLPVRTHFRFLAASPNTAAHPAVADTVLDDWKQVVPGDATVFARLLEPFFSKSFHQRHPERVAKYVRYRSNGENSQTAKAFRRQTAALRSFRAVEYFSRLDPAEAECIGGKEDRVFGPAHSRELKLLLPQAEHCEMDELGHMINIERPGCFQRRIC